MRTAERTVSIRRGALAAAIAVAVALVAQRPARADKICFNQFGHPAFPGAPPNPPDGNVDDPHWTNSFLFDYHNGTPSPDGTFKVGRDGSSLYLGWAVNNSTSFANADRVVFAFKDSAGKYRRIDMQPVCDNQAGGIAQLCNDNGAGVPVCSPGAGIATCTRPNTKPWSVIYSTGSFPTCVASSNCPACTSNADCTAASTGTCVAGTCQGVRWQEVGLPAGIQVAAKATGTGAPGTSNVWSVEIIMPTVVAGITGYTINTTAWKLYSNAFRVDPSAGGVTELTWPDAPPNAMVITTLNTPPVSTWGDAAIDGGCSGVHVKKLYTNGTTSNGTVPSPLLINHDRTDMLIKADVINTNATVAASCVRTTLRVANFGMSNAWKLVPPASSNPTAPQGIAASATATFTAGPWDVLHDAQHADYLTHTHQCIRADLDVYSGPPTNCAVGGSTTIDQASTFQNMDFGPASVFTSDPAEIRGDIAPPPSGKTANTYELSVNQQPAVTDSSVRVTVAVHGGIRSAKIIALSTGRIVNDKPELKDYEILTRLPSFGYVIDHALPAAELATWKTKSAEELAKAWKVDLGLGPEFKPRSSGPPGSYTLEIAPADVAKVTPKIEFVEEPCKGGCCGCSKCSVANGSGGAALTGFVVAAAFAWIVAWRRRRRG